MNAKTKGILSFLAVAALVAALAFLSGCQPADEDKYRDTIDDFFAALNAGITEDIKETLSSEANAFTQSLDMDYWDPSFPNRPHKITAYSESGSSAMVSTTSSEGTPFDYTFEMIDEGNSYSIRKIKGSGDYFFFSLK